MTLLTSLSVALFLCFLFIYLRKRLLAARIRRRLSRLKAELSCLEHTCKRCYLLMEDSACQEIKNEMLFSLARQKQKCIGLSLQIDEIWHRFTTKSLFDPYLQDISPVCFDLQQRILTLYQSADRSISLYWLKTADAAR